MDEHLPEIFAFNVEKLADAQRPIKSQRKHIVPPHVVGDILMWKTSPEKKSVIVIPSLYYLI